MDQYTEYFKVLSDNTRLRLLHLFISANTKLCLCELTDILEVPQYNISKHLKIMKNAGLIEEQKYGRWVYFGLVKDENVFLKKLFNTLQSISEPQFEKDLKELEKRFSLRTNGKCLVGIQKKHLTGTSKQLS